MAGIDLSKPKVKAAGTVKSGAAAAPAAVVPRVVKPAVVKPTMPLQPVAPPKAVAAKAEPATAPVPAPAAILATPVVAPAPGPVTVKPKETKMPETLTSTANGAADAIKSGASHVYSNGKAAFEQVSAKSKETLETATKSLDELSAMTKGNVEALMASTKAATAGLETIAQQVAEFSRKSFEDTTAVARAMTTVKTPNEFMQLQSDFAKAQFDAAVAEISKLTETMVKLAGEVFEPVQNRVALATDKMKSAVGTGFKL